MPPESEHAEISTIEAECRICRKREQHAAYRIPEMLFGSGDRFTYFQCNQCGCLQILTVPHAAGKYYPSDYYSFQPIEMRRGAKAFLAARRDYLWLTGWLPRRLRRAASRNRPDLGGLARLPLRSDMNVLDVGCGGGNLLRSLFRAGFRNLAGCDPFLSEDLDVAPGVKIWKRPVERMEGAYDLIMLHHVLEHIENARETLAACHRLLRPDAQVFVRVPTVDGVAWEVYREHWAGADAPRHICIYGRKSLELLAGQAGFRIERLWYDSTAYQFWLSELYQRSIPFQTEGGKVNPAAYFSPRQLREFAQRAEELNQRGKGDQLAAVLGVASPK